MFPPVAHAWQPPFLQLSLPQRGPCVRPALASGDRWTCAPSRTRPTNSQAAGPWCASHPRRLRPIVPCQILKDSLKRSSTWDLGGFRSDFFEYEQSSPRNVSSRWVLTSNPHRNPWFGWFTLQASFSAIFGPGFLISPFQGDKTVNADVPWMFRQPSEFSNIDIHLYSYLYIHL